MKWSEKIPLTTIENPISFGLHLLPAPQDFAQELQYEIQSKRNMTEQNMICLTLRP